MKLQEAMIDAGWCSLVPTLLNAPEHDSREKILVAMETLLPVCRREFQHAVPTLRTLQQEYGELLSEEQATGDAEDDDGFFQSMVLTIESLLTELAAKDEL